MNFLSFWCKVLYFLLLPLSFALNSDGVSLLSFKYSILSDPLSVLDSWNYNDETPCSWNGVTCDQIENLTVTSLVLPNSQLLGSISEQLGNLQHLRYLDLSNNFLNGSLPTSIFNSSSSLQVLSLANNVISGDLPELVGNLKSLQILNLSDNALAGSLPQNLTALKNLTFLSLKSNYFSGEIPSGFHSVQVLDLSSNLLNGSLPSDFGGERLRYLNLSYNKISGSIPLEFARKIPENSTVMDLSFNNLTGAIPESLALMKQKTLFLSGNGDLCGKPLKILCSIPSTLSNPPPNDTTTSSSSSPAIAAIPKTIDTTPESNTTSSSHSDSSSNGLKPTTIVAIIVGDLVGVSILAMVIFFVYHKRRRRDGENNHDTKTKPQAASKLKTPKPHFPCLENRDSSSSGSESEHENGSTKIEATTSDLVRVDDGDAELDMETLLKASAYVLGPSGRGRESIVYKAVVEDGRAFAVRRIGESCGVEMMRRRKDFENHVKSIAKIRHPNLVKVRGFCWGQDEKLLICDYVSNASLATSFTHRRGGCSSSSTLNLPLEMRLKIAKGIARGLSFIHDKKHVHANIKPTNILLTSEMEPIITDFGLDRLRPTGSSSSSAAQPDFSVGSSSGAHQLLPYQAPESLQQPQGLQPNPKWDVYSFGIVLLELLSGRVFSDREMDRWWESGSVEEDKNRVLRMADVGIKGEVEGREEAIFMCFKLGFRCASFNPQKRPTMKEALQILEKIPTATSQ